MGRRRVNFVISVPRDYRVDIQTSGGGIDVRTSGRSIRVQGIDGRIAATWLSFTHQAEVFA
jgi:hypothetical protein